MEYMATVWDGSTGELHPGYWLCNVTAAEVNGTEIVPLYLLKSCASTENSFSACRVRILRDEFSKWLC
jgi:hypothetical protein